MGGVAGIVVVRSELWFEMGCSAQGPGEGSQLNLTNERAGKRMLSRVVR